MIKSEVNRVMSSYIRTENQITAQAAIGKKQRRPFGNLANIDGCTDRIPRRNVIAASKLKIVCDDDENIDDAENVDYAFCNGTEKMASDERLVLLLNISFRLRQLTAKKLNKLINLTKKNFLQRFGSENKDAAIYP